MQSAHIALNGFQSKVLDAWQMPGTYRLVAVSKQNSQLSRQAWPQPHLARHCSQPNRSPSLLAATAKPVANADAVRAELVQAGIPEEVIAKVVAELLAVPMASEELQEVIKVCGERVFHQDPAAIHRRTSCFWKEFQGGKACNQDSAEAEYLSGLSGYHEDARSRAKGNDELVRRRT